ncbi:hypothetical protein BJ085DRAFT_30461 [Dimargaris cristalligena]|uniref:TFIIS N-terminal domain-containing protein n=1 Tax=Dimargaris cristalligena TaxID=215637 RepID=A0A4P9ZYG2_9FUNG|nr:hypothetical protein BJ085DRAFT_30461 [Dimargaris cristalligena]|eukprot:RKP38795.1 hypothetical protein BJ085DRAFT_30461 [Dimargaris cristalligena]
MSHPQENSTPTLNEDLFGGPGGDEAALNDLGELSEDEFKAAAAAASVAVADEPEERVRLPSFRKRVSSTDGESSSTPRPAQSNPTDRRQSPGQETQEYEPPVEAPAEEETLTPTQAAIKQVRLDFEKALKSGSGRSRKKDDVDLEAETDEILTRLRQRMGEVADLDRMYNSQRKPAIAKIKLLPIVTEQIRKVALYDLMLENNLLDSVRLWLEPLDDGSLPALDIQIELFDFLQKLPIQTPHLRESGIGKLVQFYAKCARVDPKIQKIAEELVSKWIRPLIQRSADYKDRSLRQTARVADRGPRPSQKRQVEEDYGAEDLTPSQQSRVRVPRYTVPSYDVMPTASPEIRHLAGAGRVFVTG